MNTEYFSNWLLKQLETRRWSQAELARMSGLTRASISNYMSGKIAKPDEDALKAIAHAFNVAPETVFRAAGLLPPTTPEEESFEMWKHKLAQLDQEGRERFLRQLDVEIEYQKRQQELAAAAKRKKTGPLPGLPGAG